jgi:hypothetical protein
VVMYVELLGHGAFAFTLTSGRKLRSSPRYRERILQVLPLVPRTSCEAKHQPFQPAANREIPS